MSKSRKSGYDTYVAYYNKRKEYMERQGKEMLSPLMSKSKFEEVYRDERANLKLAVEMGERKAIGNVYQSIVSQQQYSMSRETAKVLKKVSKEHDLSLNIDRQMSVKEFTKNAPKEFWQYVSDDYDDLISHGFKGKEAKAYISWLYFGSPM